MGAENFQFQILEECTLEELDEKEIQYIAEYDSIKNGYNQVEGGGGIRGWHHSEEFKKLISENNKKRPYTEKQRQRLIEYNKTRDYKHSEETKLKMRESHLGLKASEETKANCSKAQYKVWENNEERRKASSDRWKGANNPIYNMSEEKKLEVRQKIREANLGKKYSPETCEKIGALNRGTKYMTNGTVNKRVREDEFDKYLAEGYTFGRTKYWCKKEGD